MKWVQVVFVHGKLCSRMNSIFIYLGLDILLVNELSWSEPEKRALHCARDGIWCLILLIAYEYNGCCHLYLEVVAFWSGGYSCLPPFRRSQSMPREVQRVEGVEGAEKNNQVSVSMYWNGTRQGPRVQTSIRRVDGTKCRMAPGINDKKAVHWDNHLDRCWGPVRSCSGNNISDFSQSPSEEYQEKLDELPRRKEVGGLAAYTSLASGQRGYPV